MWLLVVLRCFCRIAQRFAVVRRGGVKLLPWLSETVAREWRKMMVAWWMLAFAAAMEKMVREGCCCGKDGDGGGAARDAEMMEAGCAEQ